MNEQFTKIERKVLITMFTMFNEVLLLCNDYIDIDYESYSRNDLFSLAEKLGIGGEY